MEEVTKEEDTYLRIFGKPFTRVNRRMGVVLCYAPLNSDLETEPGQYGESTDDPTAMQKQTCEKIILASRVWPPVP